MNIRGMGQQNKFSKSLLNIFMSDREYAVNVRQGMNPHEDGHFCQNAYLVLFFVYHFLLHNGKTRSALRKKNHKLQKASFVGRDIFLALSEK